MIVITGSEGFIGKNLYEFFKKNTNKKILAVDKKRIYKEHINFSNHLIFLKNLKIT